MIQASDIVPVSDLQAQLPKLIKRTRMTGCPIIVTQRGRATAALISVEEYERLEALASLGIDELERLDREGKERNDWIPWEQVKREMTEQIQRLKADAAG